MHCAFAAPYAPSVPLVRGGPALASCETGPVLCSAPLGRWNPYNHWPNGIDETIFKQTGEPPCLIMGGTG